MRYFLILNPASCGGKSEQYFDAIHQTLKKHGFEYDYEYTKSLNHAYQLSNEANKKGYDVIVAVGGDGTINRAINGFYDSMGNRISQAKFGVIYTGTSPDFCKSYQIPIYIEGALQALIKGQVRNIEIGKIEFSDAVRYFACCANIGLGAMLANHANSGIRKVYGDFFGTLISLIKTLRQYKPIDVSINGVLYNHTYNISIGKTYYIASGLKISHELSEHENKFYVLPVQNSILATIYKMYTGKRLSVTYLSEIEIKGVGAVEFDGDEGGTLPCKISCAENLEVIYERKGDY